MVRVGLLGAAGVVGQRYAQLLVNHPWFELSFVAGSERTRGLTFAQATEGKAPPPFADLVVDPVTSIEKAREICDLVFCCIGEREVAARMEELYASAGLAVVSNTSAHRNSPVVPVLIPEVNASHLGILPKQPWLGSLITKPNCSLQSYLLPLYPLHQRFGVQKVIVTLLQAVSGAGTGGLSPTEILDNVIPYIPSEEEKSEREPLKILGHVGATGIELNKSIQISAHCNRVPVTDGHLACVSVDFEERPSRQAILQAWADFEGLDLPSAPEQPILFQQDPDRPQPKLDRDAARGMAVTVGRLRECPILSWRFVGLSHNTIRGAAGGGILNAELLVTSEYFSATQPLSCTTL